MSSRNLRRLLPRGPWIFPGSEGSERLLTDRTRKDLDLLRRHVTLLKAVEEHQPIGINRLAKLSEHPQHHIRYSLRTLEHEGLVRPSQEGAVTTAEAKRFHTKLRVFMEEVKRTLESLKNSI